MFLIKKVSIIVVCIFAVFVPVEPQRCFSCSATDEFEDCFYGNSQSVDMVITNCTNSTTQCYTNYLTTNESITVQRGCSVGECFPQSSENEITLCCNTDLCNSAPPTPLPNTNRQCYFCSTIGDTTEDACYAGTTNNPIMVPSICAADDSYCFRETKTANGVTTTTRGCRSSTCSSNGCVTCDTDFCNTMKGSANFSAGGFSFAGFIMLVVIGALRFSIN